MILLDVAPLASSNIVPVLIERLIQVATDRPVEGIEIEEGRVK